MTSLESILPLLKLLPALVLEQSTYVCLYAKYHFIRANPHRSLVALARRNLQTRFPGVLGHARRVGEFTLSKNCDSSSDGFNFAPGTFVRLGQLQNRDSPGPLLPALKRLRLNNPDEWSMSQLPLFFTPSLRSLEATNIPENQQSVLLSFLITLVDEAPHLNHYYLRSWYPHNRLS
jgi:hypothetical protein